MTRGRSIFFGTILAFVLSFTAFMPTAMADTGANNTVNHNTSNHTSTSAKSSTQAKTVNVANLTALAKTEYQTALTGKWSSASVLATMQYLLPSEVLKNNENVLVHYAKDPNIPYTKFLDYEHQELYYQVGQYFLPYQAQDELKLDENLFVQSPVLTKQGIQSFYSDKNGVYQNVFMQSIEGDVFNQFFAP